MLYPKKTKNPNPSPIGNRFGFFLFGGRGWIRTTEAEKQQIYSLSPLATREHAQIQLSRSSADCLYILPLVWGFVKIFCENFFMGAGSGAVGLQSLSGCAMIGAS